MRRSRISSSRRGQYNIPDYDGNGWNPTKEFLYTSVDSWYPAWAVGGRDNASNDEVLLWKDLGPFGQDLTASYGSTAPVAGKFAGILNGRQCVRFTSTSYRLLGDGNKHGAPTGGDKTVFAVVNVASGDQWAFSKGNSDTDEEWTLALLSGSCYYDSGNAGSAYCYGGSYSTGTNLVISAKNNGGSHIFRVNGTQVVSSSGSGGTSSSTGGICIGKARNATTGSFNGSYIAEALVFRGPLDTAQMQSIERKLGAYYGCSVA